uniref:Uncharacterized protein n=1 Tax=Arundo donax TaxID=35708 RepID=A0A0A8YA25_ARUDO
MGGVAVSGVQSKLLYKFVDVPLMVFLIGYHLLQLQGICYEDTPGFFVKHDGPDCARDAFAVE